MSETLQQATRFLQEGKLEVARDLYRRTLEEQPESWQAHLGLGDAAYARANHREALGHYFQAYRQGVRPASLRQAMLVSLHHYPLGTDGLELRPFLEEALEWTDVDLQHAMRAAMYVVGSSAPWRALRADLGNPEVLLDDPLFCQVLRHCCLCTEKQEEVASALRRYLLEHPRASWCAALGWQSARSQYLLESTPAEDARVAELVGSVAPDDLLVVGMYRDLGDLPGAERFLDVGGPELRELVAELVGGRLREAKLRAALPQMGTGCSGHSEHVRSQYEEHPYPRWRHLHGCRQAPLEHWCPGWRGTTPDRPLEVLVAGAGTGQEPLTWAARLPGARITAVDISQASLAYGWRRAQELGMESVEFVHGDILELASLGRSFDMVASSGVLHHLRDPAAGFRSVAGVLRPGGVMKIALYSRQARLGISAAQELVRGQDLLQARRTLRALPEEHPARQPTTFLDFYYLSGCRDMLFHAQEHLFDLEQIGAVVEECGLALLGLEVPATVAHRYALLFPDDLERRSLACWGVFEKLYPETFELMYQFWCQKSSGGDNE